MHPSTARIKVPTSLSRPAAATLQEHQEEAGIQGPYPMMSLGDQYYPGTRPYLGETEIRIGADPARACMG